MINNFSSQTQHFCLLFGCHKRTNITLNCSNQSLHQTLVINELKSNFFDRLFLCILHTKQQHRFKVNVRLVIGDCLKFQFNRSILSRSPLEYGFNKGYHKIETRPNDSAVFSKNCHNSDIPLLYCFQTKKQYGTH